MKWAVIITSGRPSKADLLARLVFKHGGEALYLPVVKVEERGADAQEVLEALAWSEAVLFMTGQSAWGLAEMLKRHSALEKAKEMLRSRVVVCRGSKASGNVKTQFGVECPNLGETIDEMMPKIGQYVSGKRLLVSFYGVVDSELLEKLRAVAGEVSYVQTYSTVEAPEENALEAARRVAEGGYIIVFTSAVGASTFFAAAQRHGLLEKVVEALNSGRSIAAVIGPVTEEEVKRWGVEKVVKPEKPFLAYLAEELAKLLK
ncbi:MAG: uroporphyrinogen-III synthase [Pyrobaculum arsenaticum]|nr:uroporphyrinogen-III synthase [Pyrobaculum arsenaticum]MCY0891787.1 uroporphyrinogen-III synthase [Pyrobaculum arsenaticum]NYR15501.1 uroporphyrinogen-III synthase [Pyrobaculum arsenaticum]